MFYKTRWIRRIKRFFLFFVLLSGPVLFSQLYAQSAYPAFFYKGKVDSVVVKSFSVFDQETSTTNEFTASHIEMHGRIKLTNAEINTLNGYMISKDISIEYYVKDSVRQYISISSLTKNITYIGMVVPDKQ